MALCTPSGNSSTNLEKEFYVIEANKLKITLRENRITNNSIPYIDESSGTWDWNQIVREFARRMIVRNKDSGRINFYTLYYKAENVVRFYIKHYPPVGVIYNMNVLEDYYYECDYQTFMDTFGKWIN